MRYRLIFSVCCAHFLLVVLLGLLHYSTPFLSSRQKPLRITTVTPSSSTQLTQSMLPPLQQERQTQEKPPKKPSHRAKKKQSVKKQKKQLAQSHKKQNPPPVPEEESKWTPALQQELHELQEMLSSPLPSSDTLNTASSRPALASFQLSPPSIQPSLTEQENEYGRILIQFLRESLELPEAGVVKFTLVLNRQGKVVNYSFLSSSSDKNRDYVEKTIQENPCPPLSSFFPGEEQHTFVITLTT